MSRETEMEKETGIRTEGRTKYTERDFPGGPVAKTVLPMQGAQVLSLAGELDFICHN